MRSTSRRWPRSSGSRQSGLCPRAPPKRRSWLGCSAWRRKRCGAAGICPRVCTSCYGVIGVGAESLLGRRGGVLFSVEGVWGAGKTTAARLLGERLRDRGIDARVLHYGAEAGTIEALSKWLTENPLRRRVGVGGFAAPHHATVDVFLRLCREAHHHTHGYRPALGS